MRLKYYLIDKIYFIIIFLSSYLLITLILLAFKQEVLIIPISIILLVSLISLLLIDYFRKRKFYTDLLENINYLDKAYIVLETLNRPSFYEGKLLYDAFYKINKSMNENIKVKEEQFVNTKEYIEMWIHEVKKPIATLSLVLNKAPRKTKNIIKNLEDYVDQVLYYTRSENAEKDYFIKEVDLSSVIKNVGVRNMDDLLLNKIDFKVDKITSLVYTDMKWLEFIINQIINNCIKYKKKENSYIKIYVLEDSNKTDLVIEDNGIGIPDIDIKRVFDKTFTGSNGINRRTSTGMGLYIAKNLCQRLGHNISIISEENLYTKVIISFGKSKYFEVLK